MASSRDREPSRTDWPIRNQLCHDEPSNHGWVIRRADGATDHRFVGSINRDGTVFNELANPAYNPPTVSGVALQWTRPIMPQTQQTHPNRTMARNAVVIDENVRIPAEVCDLASFRDWVHSDEFPERGRISFLAGEIDVDMSPEEIETHNKVKGDVFRSMGNWIEAHDLGELLSDGVLLLNQTAGLSTVPDTIFCSWESLESARVQYREMVEGSNRRVEVYGAPDLTVEVVSRTSVRKDTVVLPKLYFAAGVDEYWLIDARNELKFQVFRRGDTQFAAVEPDGDGFLRSLVLKANVMLTRETNRRGTFRYRLVLRPTS